MQNFFVVYVFHGEADLCEKIQQLVLRPVLRLTRGVLCLCTLLNLRLKVPAICVVHYDAEFALFCLVHFSETHDIRMVQHL